MNVTNFPDPLQRAPRKFVPGALKAERLYPAPPSLQGALVGVICRDTRAYNLDSAQQLSHFPGRELMGLSWIQDQVPMYFQTLHGDSGWRQAPSNVLIAGSHLQPIVSWFPTTGRGGMAVFTADAIRDLFEIKPALLNDTMLDARLTLPASWHYMLAELLQTQRDVEVLYVLEKHLAPRLRAIRGLNSVAGSIRRQGLAIGSSAWRCRGSGGAAIEASGKLNVRSKK